jgi:CheY-like chemotaxis protein
MPQGGTLSVSTTLVARSGLLPQYPDASYPHYIRITVSDTGTGMDAATKGHIFEPFFTTKEVGKGTGLGLAMVFGVVNSHKGMIGVDTEVGKGTSFVLYFPVPPPGVTRLSLGEESVQDVRGGNETILFAEDEDTLIELVKTLLEGKGYRVLVAKDGLKAVELFQQHAEEVALVITDIGMPRLNGWEAFLRMKALRPGIGCIVATGYIDARQRSDMLKNGARDLIQKPFVPNLLLKKLRDALDSIKV